MALRQFVSRFVQDLQTGARDRACACCCPKDVISPQGSDTVTRAVRKKKKNITAGFVRWEKRQPVLLLILRTCTHAISAVYIALCGSYVLNLIAFNCTTESTGQVLEPCPCISLIILRSLYSVHICTRIHTSRRVVCGL
jgi:hypothetical protein